MKKAHFLVLLIVVVALSGCTTLTSVQSIGEPPAKVAAWPSWAKDKLTAGKWVGTNYVRSLFFTENNVFAIEFSTGSPLTGTYKILNLGSSPYMYEMLMKLSPYELVIHAWVNLKSKNTISVAWNNKRSVEELKLVE